MTRKDKILVTGANGQLGSTLREISGEFPHYEFIFTDIQQLDIASQEQVEEFFIKHSPNWIINAAAYTDVDGAESESDKAMLINAKAVEILAKEAELIGAGLVQLSSDYVFDGENPAHLKESAAKHPISVYGKSKLLGERAAKKCTQHIIVRTGWLYSPYGKNFVKSIIELAKSRSTINVVSDQWGTPTSAYELARAIIAMIDAPEFGVFNFSGEGVATWAMFAEEIIMLCGLDCDVNFISSDEYAAAAKRPSFSILSKEKFQKSYDFRVEEWEISLHTVIEKLMAQ